MGEDPQEFFSSDAFAAGLVTRREVLGPEYVDASVARATSFNAVLQQMTTEWAWNFAWNRPGLDRRTRSLMNIAMLTATGKTAELALHVKGAVNNGVTTDEIREALIQATVYAGIPAGLEGFKTAQKVLVTEGVLPAEGE